MNGALSMILNTRIRQYAESLAGKEASTEENMKQTAQQVAKEVNEQGLVKGSSAVVADGTALAISSNTVWRQDYIRKILGQTLENGQVGAGIYKLYGTLMAASDEDNAGVYGDDAEKGMKWSSRSLKPMRQHLYDKNSIDKVAENYNRLYGDKIASGYFNRILAGIAEYTDDGTVDRY